MNIRMSKPESVGSGENLRIRAKEGFVIMISAYHVR
jgi:hypothetical protein